MTWSARGSTLTVGRWAGTKTAPGHSGATFLPCFLRAASRLYCNEDTAAASLELLLAGDLNSGSPPVSDEDEDGGLGDALAVVVAPSFVWIEARVTAIRGVLAASCAVYKLYERTTAAKRR